VSTSGAVAALGDTLFPAASLGDGLRADLSSSSHLLIRLRVLHPVFAVITALGLIIGTPRLCRGRGPAADYLSRAVATLVAIQVALGFANVALLAPVWMQILHLLVADAVWIAFVLFGARLLAEAPGFERSAVGNQFMAADTRVPEQ
jgi:cytochrome c oxidase assembly protein subunit 15